NEVLEGTRGTRPVVGLRPKTPQNDAGIRIDPAPSLPCASVASPVATAAPDPPLEPPAVRSRFQGLRVGPLTRLPESPFQPNSGVVVLPSITIPASISRSTSGVPSSGTWSA